MASKKSYTITHSNNITEKEGLDYLISSEKNFIHPDREWRKVIMEMLWVDKKYFKSFDLILIPWHTNLEEAISLNNIADITLIELKTTKKKLVNNPTWFFFGATENEFNLAEQLWEKYQFCFVSLHEESKWYKLLTLKSLEEIIKRKRIQYQINL